MAQGQKPECYCCLELSADRVTYCCFQGLCQLCAQELGSPLGSATKPASSPDPKHCLCGQQYQGSQLFTAQLAAESDVSHAQHQADLDQERVKMEDWFKQAGGGHVVWHLDVPLLDYYQAEVKAFILTQERLDRVKAFPSGYSVATLPDYRFKPPGHIMYHPHIFSYEIVQGQDHMAAAEAFDKMPQPMSIQPHSFEEIMHWLSWLVPSYPSNRLPADNWSLTEDLLANFNPSCQLYWSNHDLATNPKLDNEKLIKSYLADLPTRLKTDRFIERFRNTSKCKRWLLLHKPLSKKEQARIAQSDQEIYDWHQDLNNTKGFGCLTDELTYPGRKLDVKFIDQHRELKWEFSRLFANPNIKWQW